MSFPSVEQADVISHRGSPLIVVAGPGTGKTRTLVERMIQLLGEDSSREVTFVTFTRTSMRDTEEKLHQEFGDSVFELPGVLFPRTSTLHTYAKRLVHRYAHLIDKNPSFSILIESKGEKSLVIEEVIRDIGISISNDSLSEGLAELRSTNEWPVHFSIPISERIEVLERYEELLEFYRTLDMQGVVLAACQILQSSDAALPIVFLQVDEYQDLNPIDQQFIDLISSHPASEIVVVGDDAQSIYRFRFANFEGVSALWHSNDWRGVRFPDSFRLPAHILNAALDLLNGRSYIGSNINRKDQSEKRILTLQCTSADLQIEAIARDISARLSEVDVNNNELSYKDFLVLCPTGTQVDLIVQRMNNSFNIPAKSPTRPTIPDDYWKLLLLFRMAASGDPLAIRQWLVFEGFTPSEIFHIRNGAMDSHIDFFDYCIFLDEQSLEMLRVDLESISRENLESSDMIDILETIEGIEIPIDFDDFLKTHSSEDGILPSVSQIVTLLYEHLGIFDVADIIVEDDRVLIATMHGAKGLEAKFVYCAWMNSTFMPLPGRDEEEQRRILYVALTRAKVDVIITFPERFDPQLRRRSGIEELSPFLEEITDHLNIIRANANLIRSDPLPWIN